jgi:ribose transport system substrate-binding protein
MSLVRRSANAKQRHVRKGMAVAAVLSLALIGAGCGSDSSSSSSSTGASTGSSSGSGENINIDVGLPKPISWKKGQKVKIAFFEIAVNNGWTQSQVNGAKAEAAKLGASIQIFDAKGDAQTQFNQIQTALTGGQFNAFMTTAVSAPLVCNILTKQAPAKNILVIATHNALCENGSKSGPAQWVPGMLSFIGGLGSPAFWTAFAEDVVKDNPGPTKAILLEGPGSDGTSKNSAPAIAAVVKQHPDFKIVSTQPTDYTAAGGFKAAQTALLQNPDATVVMSVYSGSTQGAAQAIKAAGLTNKVKLYDQGGDASSIAAIKAGTQQMTAPLFPQTGTETAVQLFVKAGNGEKVPRYVANDGSKYAASDDAPFFVTKENVDSFKAEYK